MSAYVFLPDTPNARYPFHKPAGCLPERQMLAHPLLLLIGKPSLCV
jgi:hypothetical protein